MTLPQGPEFPLSAVEPNCRRLPTTYALDEHSLSVAAGSAHQTSHSI